MILDVRGRVYNIVGCLCYCSFVGTRGVALREPVSREIMAVIAQPHPRFCRFPRSIEPAHSNDLHKPHVRYIHKVKDRKQTRKINPNCEYWSNIWTPQIVNLVILKMFQLFNLSMLKFFTFFMFFQYF